MSSSLNLEIAMFPCLSDNYGFLIHDSVSGETATIDTPDADEIARQCEARGWTLTQIWNTHHHFDHTDGNVALKDRFGLRIIGGDKARIPGLDDYVSGGDVFRFGDHDVHVIDTPGHTLSHIIFYVPDAGTAFVGDTIFVMGCGRLFEGTPAQMYHSLAHIRALPDATTLYCAHEYTLSNGAFALTVEPDNQDLKDYMERAEALRAKGLPTVPTTVARERLINPFMRADSPERLGEIRAQKDQF